MGKKSKDKGRWFIGIKLCWLLLELGQVVAWDSNPANTPEVEFHHLVLPFLGFTIVLADFGKRDAEGVCENLKLCPKGAWNERMLIETALSMVTVVCDLLLSAISARPTSKPV